MTLTGPDIRVLQVHPTRFCNMRCLHCYSSSGPEERSRLEVPLLEQAIGHAARLGYNVLSVSGGEPLLYPGLPAICAEARRNRMTVTLVTNGTAMTTARVTALAGLVDAVAISIDGAPPRHNRTRNYPRAFERMEQQLDLLRQHSIPFGFVYTLTRYNLSELEWAADFAVAQGARLLQVHPVEDYGRALSHTDMQSLPEQEMALSWLVVDCLRSIHEGRLNIQFDSLHRDALPLKSGEVGQWKAALDRGVRSLGEIVSPLVIEDDATVVPLRYGFPRTLALGNLYQQSLDKLASTWVRQSSGAFCELYSDVLRRIGASNNRFFNMYEMWAEEAAHRGHQALKRRAVG